MTDEPPPAAPHASLQPKLAPSLESIGNPLAGVSREMAIKRAGSRWFSLVYLGLIGWLDYITHRDLLFLFFALGLTVVLVLFPHEVSDWARKWIDLRGLLARVPPRWRPVLPVALAGFYFYARGAGTSGAGESVLITMLAVAALMVVFGGRVDARLAPFYERRDRLLPRTLRMALTPVIALVLSFGLVHGNLGDFPAFYGGRPTLHRSPAGRSDLVVFAVLLSAAASYLLLRQPPAAPHPASPAAGPVP
ncbi:MAG: hypothetical protein ACYDGR_17110 [Candidatus Dormibacteria bacterium]